MTLLRVEGVTKRFGGVHAVQDVSFEVEPQEIVGILGPNGAGKSTVFDIIAGAQPPTGGRVVFKGQDVTALSPQRRSRLGIARTFQKLRPFADMTVERNVAVGALPRSRSVAQAMRAARDCLDLVGLGHKATAFAGQLSTGQRKRLEMARALATKPDLLMLDEVTGGVDIASIPGLVALVRTLREQGLTVLVIEHNMSVITDLADRVIVLHLGQQIAMGEPEAVMRDPRVEESYLGVRDAAS